MHGNRACADPASQAGKQAGKVTYCTRLKPDGQQPTNARPQPQKEKRRGGKQSGRYREEARRRHSKGSGEKAGPALHPLHTARHMAAACWITNSGNLESPPVKSSLAFPSSSRLSNTIKHSLLCFFPSLLSGPLLCSSSRLCTAIRSPSSITPQLNICFGRVILWPIFPYSLLLQIHNKAQLAHPTMPRSHTLVNTRTLTSIHAPTDV